MPLAAKEDGDVRIFAANGVLGEVIVEIRHRATGIRDELSDRKALLGDDEGAPLCGRGAPSPGGVKRSDSWP